MEEELGVPALARSVFNDIDTNSDGVIDRSEFANAYAVEPSSLPEGDIDFGGVMNKIGDILESFQAEGQNPDAQGTELEAEAEDQFIANITAQIRNIMSDRAGDTESQEDHLQHTSPGQQVVNEQPSSPAPSRAALAAGLSLRLQQRELTKDDATRRQKVRSLGGAPADDVIVCSGSDFDHPASTHRSDATLEGFQSNNEFIQEASPFGAQLPCQPPESPRAIDDALTAYTRERNSSSRSATSAPPPPPGSQPLSAPREEIRSNGANRANGVPPPLHNTGTVDDARRNMLQEKLAARQQELQKQRNQDQQLLEGTNPESVEPKESEPDVLIEVESGQYNNSPDARRNQLQQRLAARQQQMQERKAARTAARDTPPTRERDPHRQQESERAGVDIQHEDETDARRNQLQQKLADRQQRNPSQVAPAKQNKPAFKPADTTQRMPSSRRTTPRAEPKTLQELFERYCDGRTMDVAQFCKFARNYGLVPSVFDIKEMREMFSRYAFSDESCDSVKQLDIDRFGDCVQSCILVTKERTSIRSAPEGIIKLERVVLVGEADKRSLLQASRGTQLPSKTAGNPTEPALSKFSVAQRMKQIADSNPTPQGTANQEGPDGQALGTETYSFHEENGEGGWHTEYAEYTQYYPATSSADASHVNEQYAEAQYAEAQYAEAQYAEAQYSEAQYAEAQYAEAQYAEAQYSEAQYSEAQYAEAQYPEAQYPEAQYPEAHCRPYVDEQYADEQYADEQYADGQYPDPTEDVYPEDQYAGESVAVADACIAELAGEKDQEERRSKQKAAIQEATELAEKFRKAGREVEAQHMDRIANSADPDNALTKLAHDAMSKLQNTGVASVLQQKSPEEPRKLTQAGIDFANWVMDQADKHQRNGVLSVNELRTFLPNHPFTSWLTRNKQNMVKYDSDSNGAIDLDELMLACDDYEQTEDDVTIDSSNMSGLSQQTIQEEEVRMPASMKGLTKAQYEEALRARAEAGLPPPELSAKPRETTAPVASDNSKRNSDREQAAAQSLALVNALQRQQQMSQSAEVVLKAKGRTSARSSRGTQAAKPNNSRTSSPRRAGSAARQRPPKGNPQEGNSEGGDWEGRKEYQGYSPPKTRKLSARQIDHMVDRLNQAPARERVRIMALKAQQDGFMESVASETHGSDASTSSKKKVSKGQEQAIIDRLYQGESQTKAERMNQLRNEALDRELAECRHTPVISSNTQQMTRNMEPFMKRVAQQQAEHNDLIARKRAEYEEAEASQATFMPEISMVSHQMDRSVDDLMRWQKDREMRRQFKQQDAEKDKRNDSPFRPQLSKKTKQIVSRMAKSSDDGCRSTARAEARAKGKKTLPTEPKPSFTPTINSRSSRLDMGDEVVFDRLYRQATGPVEPTFSSRTAQGVAVSNGANDTGEQWVVGPAKKAPVARGVGVEVDGPSSAQMISEERSRRYNDIYGEFWKD